MLMYQSVLVVSKTYVFLFQLDRSLIHKVYYKQIECVKKCFSYFVKPDVLLKSAKPSHYLGLELKEKNLLPSDLLFVGGKARKGDR